MGPVPSSFVYRCHGLREFVRTDLDSVFLIVGFAHKGVAILGLGTPVGFSL